MKLLLASASPARRKTLIAAGITPLIAVADVCEEELLLALKNREPSSTAATQVQLLATAKARNIAKLIKEKSLPEISEKNFPRIIIGCDSMFDFAGEVVGKPHTKEISRERLRKMRGNYGDLYTGHCIIDTQTGEEITGISSARVYLSDLSDAEIEAYIDAGEPLEVAGSFTIDGYGGPFIEQIDGDHHGVVGISLPLLRKLLAKLNLSIVDFWDIRQ